MKIKAIFFDFDQTIIELGEIHYLSLNQSLKEIADISIDINEHNNTYNGLTTNEKLKLLTKNKNLSTILYEPIKRRKQELTHEYLKSFKITIQFKSLFKSLKEKGYKIAICSNSIKTTTDLGIDKLKVREYIDLILTSNDVKETKPSSEIYLKAISFFNLKSEECLAIEDSIYGIESAKNANLNIIIVKNPKEVHKRLIKFLNENS